MRNQLTFPRYKWLAFMFVAAVSLYAAPVAAQDASTLSFKLQPAVIQVGRTRDVRITPSTRTDLTNFEVQEPAPTTGVMLEKVDNAFFRLTSEGDLLVRVKVDQDADPQSLNLVLHKKQAGNVIARYTAALEITEFTPRPMIKQPVPAGLDPKEAVDAKFQPLSYEATKDVFGRKVADTYYAVAVGLGNNTGFDLQITKLAFSTNIFIDVPDVDPVSLMPMCRNGQPTCADNEVKMRKEFLQIAAIDSNMVRGSIEKEQNFGRRALALNLVGGVGTLTTGFLPFFKALGPRANFASFTSILNGQFKEGFGLAVPDLTIRHLNRLENGLVMDEQLILPNNSEKNTVIFVPRSALHRVNYKGEGKQRKPDKNREGWDDLIEIRRKLGRLVIVGRPLERYANREIVVRTGDAGATSNTGFRGIDGAGTPPAPAAPTPSPTIPSVTGIATTAGLATETKEIKITGTNFTADTKVTVGGTRAAVVVTSPTSLSAFLPAYALAENALEEAADITVTNPDGQKSVAPSKYTYYAPLGVSGADRASGAAAGGETIKIFGTGFRQDAKVRFDGVELPPASVTVAADGKSITVKTPPHTAGNVKVLVVNPKPYPTQKGEELAGGFTYNP